MGSGSNALANSVADVLDSTYNISPAITGVTLFTLAALVILGGVQRIAGVATRLVPTMAVLHISIGLLVIILNFQFIPQAVAQIFAGAFGVDAVAGGFVFALFWMAMQRGVARGIFSNEAGQGSAPIAHAAAKTNSPVDQGIVAMLGTFIDTLIVCTITGFVILTANIIPEGCDPSYWYSTGTLPDICEIGAPLTASAFDEALPGIGEHVVAIGLAVFAFTTILGWSYYGERCTEYLFGEKSVLPFRLVYLTMTPLGALVLFLGGADNDGIIGLVWLTVDTLTALMAAPNLIALAVLSPVVFKATEEYFKAHPAKLAKL